jgi:DNA-binding transcriptional MerR regulator
MGEPLWKVGELARRTGVSVRALHHYDAVGLLRPSRRAGSGHRLYAAADVARLQQICSLRQLGFSLEEIASCLGRPGLGPLEVVRLHIARLREQLDAQRRLLSRLVAVEEILGKTGAAPVEELMRVVEGMTMMEKYYTPEQLEQLRRRGEAVGQERIRQVQAEWPALIAEVRAAMERGDDPAGGHVQGLMRRWTALVEEFTGGDPGIEASVRKLWQNEGPALERQHGMGLTPEVFAYVEKARAAAAG